MVGLSGQSTRKRGHLLVAAEKASKRATGNARKMIAAAERARMRTTGNTRKVLLIAFVVIVSVRILFSVITAHNKFNDFTSGQTLGDKVDKLRATNSTSDVPMRVGPEELFNPDNIPPFMRDYFEWHGKQLQQMQEDAKLSQKDANGIGEKNAYLAKYRFLVLRCASTKINGKIVEDRCGGLSDRIKTFPLFIWYASKTNRILFIRWGNNRPAPIQTFLSPGDFWNWTFPNELLSKIEELEEKSNPDETFSRVYYDGTNQQHNQLLKKIKDPAVWMVEGNDFSGGAGRYELFVNTAINERQENRVDKSNNEMIAKLRPEDALYRNFYHDVFHATFRPSAGVQNFLDSYFDVPENDVPLQPRSWLPVPLKRNQYAMAQYRAAFPGEPYRASGNETILRETSYHAVECAKSRVANAKGVSNIYVTSDTALVVEAVRDKYRDENARPSEGDSMHPFKVWTNLDLITYDTDATGGNEDGVAKKTKPTIALAEDPPHLNFATPDDVSAFYVIFVDLFLMSYANCVVHGAGGFGRMGSLVSYRPFCGTAFSVQGGKLKDCVPFD